MLKGLNLVPFGSDPFLLVEPLNCLEEIGFTGIILADKNIEAGAIKLRGFDRAEVLYFYSRYFHCKREALET